MIFLKVFETDGWEVYHIGRSCKKRGTKEQVDSWGTIRSIDKATRDMVYSLEKY